MQTVHLTDTAGEQSQIGGVAEHQAESYASARGELFRQRAALLHPEGAAPLGVVEGGLAGSFRGTAPGLDRGCRVAGSTIVLLACRFGRPELGSEFGPRITTALRLAG